MKLVCALVRGRFEVGGVLHDAPGGPVLAPFRGGRVYRASQAAPDWFVRLIHEPALPEETAFVERARVAGWSVMY